MLEMIGLLTILSLGALPFVDLFDGGSEPEEEDEPEAPQSPPVSEDGELSIFLTGTDEAELIVGTDEADMIDGMQGADTLLGGEGNDTLTGTVSDHWTESDMEIAVMDGGDGDDLLVLSDHTHATGGEGADEFLFMGQYSEGNQIEDFDASQDTISIDLTGYSDFPDMRIEDTDAGDAELYMDDTLIGTVVGAAGVLTESNLEFTNAEFAIEGTDGDDTLAGGSGPDTLDGGDGADLIRLDDGDTGIGGAGEDKFIVPTDASSVLIEDFEPGSDVLCISYDSAEGTWPAPQVELFETSNGDVLVTCDQGLLSVTLSGMAGQVSLADLVIAEAATLNATGLQAAA